MTGVDVLYRCDVESDISKFYPGTSGFPKWRRTTYLLTYRQWSEEIQFEIVGLKQETMSESEAAPYLSTFFSQSALPKNSEIKRGCENCRGILK